MFNSDQKIIMSKISNLFVIATRMGCILGGSIFLHILVNADAFRHSNNQQLVCMGGLLTSFLIFSIIRLLQAE